MSTLSSVSSSLPVSSTLASTSNVQLSEQTIKAIEGCVTVGGTVIGVGFGAGLSALAAGLFTAVSPLGGAIFGIGSLVGHKSVAWLCDKVGCEKESLVGKTLNKALPIIASIGAGCAALSAAGYAWTPGAVAAIYLGGYAISIGVVGALTLGAISFIAYMGYNLSVEPNSTSGASSTTV